MKESICSQNSFFLTTSLLVPLEFTAGKKGTSVTTRETVNVGVDRTGQAVLEFSAEADPQDSVGKGVGLTSFPPDDVDCEPEDFGVE